MALRFAHRHDEVFVLHVCNSDKMVLRQDEHFQLMGDSAVKLYYEAACAKAKSLGAAKKRDPVVRLEHCVNYSEPLYPAGKTGFCFMDSPGKCT